MKYLLDTNSCIEALRRGPKSKVVARLANVHPTDVAVSAVVLLELLYGAYRSQDPNKELAKVYTFINVFPILPVDELVADEGARIRAHLDTMGLPIGPNDLLIAAAARFHGLTVVTNNISEFSRVPGLFCEDWLLP